MSPGEEVSRALSGLEPKLGEAHIALLRKKMSRRSLLELAQSLEEAAGLLRRIAGVKTHDDTERSGPTD